jgi:hypothetical protein
MRRTSSSLWGPTVGAQYLTLRVLGPRTTARVWGADSELSGCARSTGPPPKSCTTWAPASRTGVPNKYYRGPRQASSRDCRRKRPTTRANKPNLALTRPHENVPGSPTNTTGVPDKYHRGPRQIPPGSPTNTTGVPDKYHRGPRQIPPGSPTSGSLQSCCKTGVFVPCFGVPLFLFLL